MSVESMLLSVDVLDGCESVFVQPEIRTTLSV